jgi:phosphorylcholine metabolism protein LicD
MKRRLKNFLIKMEKKTNNSNATETPGDSRLFSQQKTSGVHCDNHLPKKVKQGITPPQEKEFNNILKKLEKLAYHYFDTATSLNHLTHSFKERKKTITLKEVKEQTRDLIEKLRRVQGL